MDSELTLQEQFAKLAHLGNRRIVMESQEIVNPDSWQDLANQYTAIGAKSNAARCEARAKYYRGKFAPAAATVKSIG